MGVDKVPASKQRAFINAWIENGGNGTRAALKTLGCSTTNVAESKRAAPQSGP